MKSYGLTLNLTIVAGCLVMVCGMPQAREAGGDDAGDLEAYRQARRAAARRQRRIIYNNDADDAKTVPRTWPATPESMLKLRTHGVEGTQVDTIFYCSLQGPKSLHPTEAGEIYTGDPGDYHTDGALGAYFATRRSIVQDLLDQGTDPLQVMVDFCREHGIEIFCSMRMNDTHDAVHRPDRPYPHFSQFKQDHPETLMGSLDNRPRYGSWTAFDFARKSVRDLAFRRLEEVCRNYDVDGLELDFFRHGVLFKTVAWGGRATAEELDMMTDLVRRIRRMTEEKGLQRGKPILLAVRVPDSVEYNRAIGLDLERWLAEGLVDILITTCYFRFHPWEYSVELGRRYGVPVYAGLSESRVAVDGRRDALRHHPAVYRARAMEAWRAGVDGIYMFNFFNPGQVEWSELGDPATLRGKSKVYFVSVRDGNPGRWLAGANDMQVRPLLNPQRPQVIPVGHAYAVDLRVGDDLAGDMEEGREVVTRVHLRVGGIASPGQVEVRMNGQPLQDGILEENRLVYDVEAALVRPGANRFEVSLHRAASGAPGGEQWDMEYRGNHVMTMPEQLPWRRLAGSVQSVEEVRDGALFLADRGAGGDDHMVHLMYPWLIVPGDETVVDVRVKVVASDDPRAVTVRVANGEAVEYLTLAPGEIGLYYAGLRHAMDTTSEFRTYRIVMRGQNIRVFADGELALDGTFLLTTPAADRTRWLPLLYGHDEWNERSLLFGSASGPGAGEALWEFIRYRTESRFLTLKDLAVAITFDNEREEDAHPWNRAMSR